MTLEEIHRKTVKARSVVNSGQTLSIPEIAETLNVLLIARDLSFSQEIFRQLPPQAFQRPDIAAMFLRYLVLCSEHEQAERFAADIRQSNRSLPEGSLANVIDCILNPIEDLEQLSYPEVCDYSFDLEDGHYRMTFLLECPHCHRQYKESTGWGVMVLRPSFCAWCLHPSLISPDFLVNTLKKFHIQDGKKGFRKIDDEINRIVSEWHLSEEFPPAGYYGNINVAEPLMLRVQRLLVKELYLERLIRREEITS
jgi:hypothetical protein